MESYIGQAVPLGIPIPEANLDLPSSQRRRWAPSAQTTQTVGWIALLVLTIAIFSGGLLRLESVATAIQRITWVVLFVAIVWSLMTRSLSDLVKPFAAFLPVFAIGVVSGVIALQPIDAIRSMILWLISALAASMIGVSLTERKVGIGLSIGFILMLGLSVAVTILRPKFGHDVEIGNVVGKEWRGIFPGKNFLGWYAGFAVLLALFAPRQPLAMRAVLLVVALPCLYFAHSAGGIVTVAASTTFAGLIFVTRRLNVSASLQMILLCLLLSAIVLFAFLSSEGLLHVLGKNSTLTGRTLIWQAYFDRALDQWLLGTGPGSFSGYSLASGDIGLHLQGLGNISTPHNMYIAIFGEIGILGLAAYLVPLLYFALLEPILGGGQRSLLMSTMTLQFMIGGLDETHQVFGTGFGTFIMIMVHAARRQDNRKPLKLDPAWLDMNSPLDVEPLGALPPLASYGPATQTRAISSL